MEVTIRANRTKSLRMGMLDTLDELPTDLAVRWRRSECRSTSCLHGQLRCLHGQPRRSPPGTWSAVGTWKRSPTGRRWRV